MNESIVDAMNSPYVVVILLAIVFGFVSMGLDKLIYLVRSLTKKTPTDTIAKSYDALVPVMDKLGHNLEKLNEKLDHQAEIHEKNHKIVEQALNRIESRFR